MAATALLLCVIVGISDGDTLTARCSEPEAVTVKVRLAEIDAPERRQAFGTRSRHHLAALCFRKRAEVAPTTKDRYDRLVARVRCEGRDASAEQLRAGMAWVYTRYSTDPALPPIEAEARRRRAGLWADPAPVPPWAWRRDAGADRRSDGQRGRQPHAALAPRLTTI